MAPQARRPRRIDQFVNSLASHDAVGGHIRALRQLFLKSGFESEVFVEQNLSKDVTFVKGLDQYRELDSSDNIVIYHHSIGSSIPNIMARLLAYKIVSYHNITPPRYFEVFHEEGFRLACENGIRQLAILKLATQEAWTVTRYNADELRGCGYVSPQVFSILRDYQTLSRLTGDAVLEASLDDDVKNIIFVGRITPHKGQHSLFEFLRTYKQRGLPHARLILVGGNLPIYLDYLRDLARELGLTLVEGFSKEAPAADIWIPGSVSEDQLKSIYAKADVFFCLSEHEGFCVPLVEAMAFGVPVVAHRAAAVPETLGDGGVLVDKRDVDACLETIKQVLTVSDFAAKLAAAGKKRSEAFAVDKNVSAFQQVFDATLHKFDSWNGSLR